MKLFFAAALVLASAFASGEISVVDDAGRTVTIDEPAQKIISLAPHLTEILFELGVGDRIKGTVRYSDYPEAAKSIPRLGDAFTVNIEAVVALQPDIILAWRSGGSMAAVERLTELGFPVYINEAPTLDAIPRSVASIAKLVGKSGYGDALADGFTRRMAALGTRATGISVFFQIADEQLYTVDDSHLIGQAISACGARNVFAELPTAVALVSQESVLAANPDLIIMTRVPDSPPSPWVEKWGTFASLNSAVADIDPNLISRPGIRMAEGIERLCALVDEVSKSSQSTAGLR